MSELPLAIPDTLRKGDVIDGYELLRPFQHSDRVWLAQKDGQRWTLKFAPRRSARRRGRAHAFVRETWNATRLQSASCSSRRLCPRMRRRATTSMEFIEAPSLKTLLRSRRLAVDEAIALGRFPARGQRAQLLRLDLVHGDIKPENILVVSGYDRLRFKLVDLGSAAEVFSITSRAGTASYLAPERFHGAPICERTEIFAIGVTLYEALTGAFPYGEIERFQTPHFSRAEDHQRSSNPNLPPWLDAVILRAIAADPARRYQHFSECVSTSRIPSASSRSSPMAARRSSSAIRSAFTQPASGSSSPASICREASHRLLRHSLVHASIQRMTAQIPFIPKTRRSPPSNASG